MDELFQHIETRIRTLLQKQVHLKKSNDRMEQLLIKQKSAVVLIESLIARLKSIEGIS